MKRRTLGFVLLLAAGMLVLLACSSSSGGDSSSGKVVFDQYCNSCHPSGSAGKGREIKGWPADSLKRIVREGGSSKPTFMPSFATEKINDQQLNALASYVASLK